MLNKKLMILAIFIITLLAVTVVSAADNATADIVSVGITDDVASVENANEFVATSENDNEISSVNNTETVDVENTIDELLSVENDDQLITEGNDSEVGSFADLETEINNVEEGGVLNLTKDYKYVNSSMEGISINKTMTIDGQGHAIDGNQLSRIFIVDAENVLLKNIIFVNGFHNSFAGAISGEKGVTLINCSFFKCFSHGEYGGAIRLSGESEIINCSFVNCYSSILNKNNDLNGGAIYYSSYDSNYLHISDCNFINCSSIADGGESGLYGGAIYFSCNSFVNITCCTFSNCSLLSSKTRRSAVFGGAIFGEIDGNTNIEKCRFINCFSIADFNSNSESSNIGGGAIYIRGTAGNIENCYFLNCSNKLTVPTSIDLTSDGGAILIEGSNFNIENSAFVNCSTIFSHLNSRGGAIFMWFDGNTINNCSFINNYATNGGAVSFGYADSSNINNSRFINNSAVFGGAIYLMGIMDENNLILIENSTFIDNSASDIGNSIYCYECYGVVNNSIFTPDFDNFASSNSYFIVIKQNSKIDFNDSCFDYNNVSFPIILYGSERGLAHKKLSFRFIKDDESKIFNVSTSNDGICLLSAELNDLGAGIWNVTVIFEGNDNYAPCNATATITVLPPSSSVTVVDVNTTVGHEVSLVANVNSSLTVNDGVVTFFDGETQIGQSNVNNGVASLTYTPATAGEHNITAVFSSDNYLSSNNTAILSVEKAEVILRIDNIQTVYFTNPSNFAVNVLSNSKGINEGNIKYYVNNNYIGMSYLYDGKTSTEYIANATGSFDLLVVYEETDNYYARNASTTFSVNKMPTSLSGETVFFDEEESKTYSTTLKDDNNNGVYGQTVKIETVKSSSGESKTFTGVSDSNGITIYDVDGLAGGMWIIRGIYDGNGNYIGSGFSDKFIVIRMNTSTTIADINNPQKDKPIHFHADINDEFGNPVTDGNAHFYLDGEDLGYIDLGNHNVMPPNTNDSNLLGAINPVFNYKLEDNSDLYIEYTPKDVGTHTLTVVYEGTSIYKSSNQTTTFFVSDGPVTTNLTAKSIDSIYNEESYLIATLKDIYGNPIKDVLLSVELNGIKNYITDENGTIKVSTKGLATGNYSAVITFAGNENYTESNATVNVIITQATVNLNANYNVTVLNDGFAITFVINTDPAINNETLTISFNGNEYPVTVFNGVANFTSKKVYANTYSTTISYAGSKSYSNSSTTVDAIVKTTTVSRLNTFTYYYYNNDMGSDSEKGISQIKVVDSDGNPIKNGLVTITIMNKYKLKVRTNGQGIAKFTKAYKPGTYSVTATHNNKVTKLGNLVLKSVVNLPKLSKVSKSAKTTTIKITLKGTDPIKGKTVVVSFMKVNYKVRTDKNGVALFKVTKDMVSKLAVGKTYTVRATYRMDSVAQGIQILK